jgi:exonuclease SbcD
VRYSGSLLKYSFSEVGHEKSVTLVEMDAAGCCTTELLPLTPRRDMRIVEGAFETLLQGPGVGESREDYLLVRLSDKKAILDPMGRLRQVYPNVLHLERPGLLEYGQLEEMGQQRLRQSERQLFGSFFQQMTGDEPSTEQERVFDEVVDSLHRKEREAVP